MGGALASLQAHDLSRLYPNNRVRMYNCGSPRIGNSAFAREYGRANGDSYRIVNEWDVIARFPRGLNAASIFNYDHVGKTALLNFAPNVTLWVEGEQEGPCPLRDMAPLRPAASSVAAAAAAKAQQPSKGGGSGNSEPTSAAVELEPLFLEAEWQLLNALLNGAGFSSHLEFRYFEALCAAQRQQQQQEPQQGAGQEPQQEQGVEKTTTKEAGHFLMATSSSSGGASVGPAQPQQPGQQQSAGTNSGSSGIGGWFRVPINPLDIVAAATNGGGAK